MAREFFEGAFLEVEAGVDAEGFHAFLGDGADAGDAGDGQGVHEGVDFVGRDDFDAVRFVDVACDLGQEFVGGDSGGGGEAGFLKDTAADFVGDERGAAVEVLVVGDVEEGFVEGEWFDEV